MRRARVATFGVVAALGTGAAVALAQQPVPTLPVTASPTAVAVQAPGPVAAGPTRFEVTRQGNKDLSVYFILLNAGVSQQEFQAALRRDDQTGGESAVGLVSIPGSVSVSGRETRRAVTFALRPGLNYLVLSEVDQADGGGPPQRALSTFTTSAQANGAAARAPAATIRMSKLRFRGSAVLPKRGVVRVQNNDGVPHFALAFPLRKGVSSSRLGSALRSSNPRALGRVAAGAPYGVQNIVSGGNTSNDQEVAFTKAGRYGLVCFVDGHEQLGMYRVVSVK